MLPGNAISLGAGHEAWGPRRRAVQLTALHGRRGVRGWLTGVHAVPAGSLMARAGCPASAAGRDGHERRGNPDPPTREQRTPFRGETAGARSRHGIRVRYTPDRSSGCATRWDAPAPGRRATSLDVPHPDARASPPKPADPLRPLPARRRDAHTSVCCYFLEPSGGTVVDEPADVVLVGDEGAGLDAGDRLPDVLV